MKGFKISAEITMGDENSLYLSADSMNELVDKIIEWQAWDNQPHDLMREAGTLEEHRDSPWYYLGKSATLGVIE